MLCALTHISILIVACSEVRVFPTNHTVFLKFSLVNKNTHSLTLTAAVFSMFSPNGSALWGETLGGLEFDHGRGRV